MYAAVNYTLETWNIVDESQTQKLKLWKMGGFNIEISYQCFNTNGLIKHM